MQHCGRTVLGTLGDGRAILSTFGRTRNILYTFSRFVPTLLSFYTTTTMSTSTQRAQLLRPV